MSKRQTLSERFDSLGPPKYDEMVEEQNQDVVDEGNQSDNNDTTFTVINRKTTGQVKEGRSQRISQVVDNSVPVASAVANAKYNATRGPGNRPFRREINPSPYESPRMRQSFRTNRVSENPLYKRVRPDDVEYNDFSSDLNEINGNNFRSQTRGIKRRGFGMNTNFRGGRGGFGMRGALRDSPGGRNNIDRMGHRGGGSGSDRNRGRGRGRGGGRGSSMSRGRGRGNSNRSRIGFGENVTETQLDRELERYYGNNDPQKLIDMKSDQLDREMDEYWNTKDADANTGPKKNEKVENGNNTQRSKPKSLPNENIKKGSDSAKNSEDPSNKDF